MRRILLFALLCGVLPEVPAWPQAAAPGMDPCKPLTAGCGHISGNEYHSDYFALSYVVPDAWQILSQEAIVRRHQESYEKLRDSSFRQNPNKQPFILDSWDLLVATKEPFPPLVRNHHYNTNLALWADELDWTVQTLADYPKSSGFLRENGAEALDQPRAVSFGGRSFLRMDRREKAEGIKVYHTRLVTIVGSYAVGLDLYSDSQAGLQELLGTAASLRFNARPDTGVIAGNVYHNEFFGFTFEFPQGFVPLDDYNVRMQALYSRTKRAGELPASPKAHIFFLVRYDLLSVLRKPRGSSRLNAVVSITAAMPDLLITTPQQYLETMLAGAATKGFTRFHEPHEVKVGGRDGFVRADRWGTVSEQEVYETKVVALDKGLVLVFEFVAGSQAELDEIVKSLESVRFEPEAVPAQKP